MDDREKAEAVAAIAARHVESLQRDLRQTIALRLLDANGSVSTEEIDAQFATEWVPPTAQALANVVAAKAAAAVEFHHREVEWETAAVEDARAKADKVQEKQARLVQAALADADAAEASTASAEAEARLRAAREFAEYALASGNPAAAPHGKSKTVAAQAATGKGGA
jgi:hypothetical protein